MLAVYCNDCRRRMLLPLDQIDAIHATPEGYDVSFRCIHAHRGTYAIRRSATPAIDHLA